MVHFWTLLIFVSTSSPSLNFVWQSISLIKANSIWRNFNACSTKLIPAFKKQNTGIWHVKQHQNQSSDYNSVVNVPFPSSMEKCFLQHKTKPIKVRSPRELYKIPLTNNSKSFIAQAHCWLKNKPLEATKAPKKLDLFKLSPLWLLQFPVVWGVESTKCFNNILVRPSLPGRKSSHLHIGYPVLWFYHSLSIHILVHIRKCSFLGDWHIQFCWGSQRDWYRCIRWCLLSKRFKRYLQLKQVMSCILLESIKSLLNNQIMRKQTILSARCSKLVSKREGMDTKINAFCPAVNQ